MLNLISNLDHLHHMFDVLMNKNDKDHDDNDDDDDNDGKRTMSDSELSFPGLSFESVGFQSLATCGLPILPLLCLLLPYTLVRGELHFISKRCSH